MELLFNLLDLVEHFITTLFLAGDLILISSFTLLVLLLEEERLVKCFQTVARDVVVLEQEGGEGLVLGQSGTEIAKLIAMKRKTKSGWPSLVEMNRHENTC